MSTQTIHMHYHFRLINNINKIKRVKQQKVGMQVSCHFESENVSHSVVANSLQSHGLQPTRLLCPWNSPGRNAGVGSHSLLQGIFLTQGLNPGLPHCSQTLSSEPNCFNDFLFWKIFLFSSLEEKYSLQSKYTPRGKRLIFPIQKGKD